MISPAEVMAPIPGGLLLDQEGNLYGVTGSNDVNYQGTVFKLTADGNKTILHTFTGGATDGSGPTGDLIADAEVIFTARLVMAGAETVMVVAAPSLR